MGSNWRDRPVVSKTYHSCRRIYRGAFEVGNENVLEPWPTSCIVLYCCCCFGLRPRWESKRYLWGCCHKTDENVSFLFSAKPKTKSRWRVEYYTHTLFVNIIFSFSLCPHTATDPSFFLPILRDMTKMTISITFNKGFKLSIQLTFQQLHNEYACCLLSLSQSEAALAAPRLKEGRECFR